MNPSLVSPPRLRLRWIAEYYGPNLYADSAVVVGALTGDLSADIAQVQAASDRLWAESGMVRGVEDVPEADHPHVLLALGRAAAAWAMAALNEVRGDVRQAAAEQVGDTVHLWVGFHDPALTRTALQLALKTLIQGVKGSPRTSTLKSDLISLWRSCRRLHPDYQARILMCGARDMGVPYFHFLPDSRYWQFGWGAKARVFMESSSNADGLLGSHWQKNKATAKDLMTALGLPTPAGVLVTRAEDVSAAVHRVGFPCVVKPLDSGGGKGVTANIRSLADARSAFDIARRQKQGAVMVEAHVAGDDHRLMVINGRMVGAIRREPSFVVGDGRQSVSELVERLTRPRSSNLVRSRYLRPIVIDQVLERHLATQSFLLSDIPAKGQRVTLRSNANLSTGGLCTDVTALCHPHVREMAELLAKNSGLTTIGIDYLTTDIAKAPAQTGGAFIEMNTTPGLDACVAAGWSEASIARLVLGTSVGRIPVDLTVISQSGMAALQGGEVQLRTAAGTAWVIGDDLYIGELKLKFMPLQPWHAVSAALRNQGVHHVQLVCSADELGRWGAPVDRVRFVKVAIQEGQAILSGAWIDVLSRHSEGGIAYEPEPEILSRLLSLKSEALAGR